jgi:hypothetical protein
MLLAVRLVGYAAILAGMALLWMARQNGDAAMWNWGAATACPGIVLVLVLDFMRIAKRFRRRD